MTNYFKNKNLLFIIFLFTLTIFTSCEKDLGKLGDYIIPSSDTLKLKHDTISAFTGIVVNDTAIRSSKFAAMIGYCYDDIFGTTEMSFFTRFYMEYVNISPDKFLIESVSLSMIESSYYYGDTSKALSIDIYEVKTEVDSTDYINKILSPSFPLNSEKIGELTFNPRPVNSDTLAYTFNDDFAQHLKEMIFKDYNRDSSRFYNNSLFIKNFKGLYFTTSSKEGAVISFLAPQITINYRVSSGGELKKFSLITVKNSFTANDEDDPSHIYLHPLSKCVRDYSVSKEQFISIANENKNLYVQSMLGFSSRLSVTDIDKWKDSSNIIFNKASLIIPLKDYNNFAPPSSVYLKVIYKNEIMTYLTAVADSLMFYEIPITDLLIDFYLNKKSQSDYQFEIMTINNNTSIDRAVVDCGENYKNIKLSIVYSKYE